MHAEAAVWEKRLRREFDSHRLRVRWNEDLCRYEIGQTLSSCASNHVDWFYVVQGPDNEFRPLDQRTVRKLRSMDKRKHAALRADQFRRDVASAKAEAKEREVAETAYRIKHEAEFYRGRWGWR